MAGGKLFQTADLQKTKIHHLVDVSTHGSWMCHEWHWEQLTQHYSVSCKTLGDFVAPCSLQKFAHPIVLFGPVCSFYGSSMLFWLIDRLFINRVKVLHPTRHKLRPFQKYSFPASHICVMLLQSSLVGQCVSLKCLRTDRNCQNHCLYSCNHLDIPSNVFLILFDSISFSNVYSYKIHKHRVSIELSW